MSNGHVYLADVELKLAAKLSGGDEIVDGNRLYHLMLTDADGSVYKEVGAASEVKEHVSARLF